MQHAMDPVLPAPLQKSRLVIEQNERWLPALGWSGEFLFYTDGPEWNCTLSHTSRHTHTHTPTHTRALHSGFCHWFTQAQTSSETAQKIYLDK